MHKEGEPTCHSLTVGSGIPVRIRMKRQLTPAGIYVNCPLYIKGTYLYMLPQGEQPSNLLLLT